MYNSIPYDGKAVFSWKGCCLSSAVFQQCYVFSRHQSVLSGSVLLSCWTRWKTPWRRPYPTPGTCLQTWVLAYEQPSDVVYPRMIIECAKHFGQRPAPLLSLLPAVVWSASAAILALKEFVSCILYIVYFGTSESKRTILLKNTEISLQLCEAVIGTMVPHHLE